MNGPLLIRTNPLFGLILYLRVLLVLYLHVRTLVRVGDISLDLAAGYCEPAADAKCEK